MVFSIYVGVKGVCGSHDWVLFYLFIYVKCYSVLMELERLVRETVLWSLTWLRRLRPLKFFELIHLLIVLIIVYLSN